MKKIVNRHSICVMLIVVTCFLLFSVSSFAKVTIKFAHAASPGPYKSIEESWSRVFKAVVEAESSGEIEVNIYPSSQLGDQRQAAEGVQMGTIQMASIADAVLGLFYPKAHILSIPFAFKESEDVLKFWKTDFARDWAEECANETGIRILDLTTYGFRNFTNNIRPIRSPKDMKGLKIRIMQSSIYVEMMKALGAIPTPMSVTELYSALQTGVVDGEENPPMAILLNSFQEVQKYFTNMGYIAATQPIIINDEFYKSLSDEHKAILEKARKIASKAGLGFCYISNYGVGLVKLSEDMEIYTPSDEERESFRSLAQPAALKIIEEKVGKDYLDEALEVINGL